MDATGFSTSDGLATAAAVPVSNARPPSSTSLPPALRFTLLFSLTAASFPRRTIIASPLTITYAPLPRSAAVASSKTSVADARRAFAGASSRSDSSEKSELNSAVGRSFGAAISWQKP